MIAMLNYAPILHFTCYTTCGGALFELGIAAKQATWPGCATVISNILIISLWIRGAEYQHVGRYGKPTKWTRTCLNGSLKISSDELQHLRFVKLHLRIERFQYPFLDGRASGDYAKQLRTFAWLAKGEHIHMALYSDNVYHSASICQVPFLFKNHCQGPARSVTYSQLNIEK
jgi:hypothetical protein